MTVAEKLQMMEALSRNADSLESPEWRRDVSGNLRA